MFQFTTKGLLGLVLLAAVVCTVLFVLPPGYGFAALAVGVLALPGPLVVAYRQGGPRMKTFATGGLIAYAAWFVIIGIPVGWEVKDSIGHVRSHSLSQLAANSSSIASPYNPAAPPGPMAPPGTTAPARSFFATPGFAYIDAFILFAGLYAPWCVVLAGGLAALAVVALSRPPPAST